MAKEDKISQIMKDLESNARGGGIFSEEFQARNGLIRAPWGLN